MQSYKGGIVIRRTRILPILIGVVTILFISSVLYSFISDSDAYQHYTGLGESISISPDDRTLAFSYYTNGNEAIYTGDIDSGMEKGDSEIAAPGEVYHTVLSPDEDYLAYTKVDDTSEQGTFIYELFLKDTSSGDSERLTDYDSNVISPVFFHRKERLAFLANKNWPGEPSQYEIMTVPYEGGEMSPVNLELPESDNNFQPGAFVDKLVNAATLTVLYLMMFGLSIVYCHGFGRTYWPVIVSGIITLISLISIFIAGYNNPWLGVWVMTLTMWLGVCTVILLLFAFIYQKSFKLGREKNR